VKLLEATARLTMPKEEQVSNWEAKTLSLQQVSYAAADAFASVLILLSIYKSSSRNPNDSGIPSFVAGCLGCDGLGELVQLPRPPTITIDMATAADIYFRVSTHSEESQWVTCFSMANMPSRSQELSKPVASQKKRHVEGTPFLMLVGRNAAWEARAGNLVGWSSATTITKQAVAAAEPPPQAATTFRPPLRGGGGGGGGKGKGKGKGRGKGKGGGNGGWYKNRITDWQAEITGAIGRYERKGSAKTSHTPTHYNLLLRFSSYRVVVPPMDWKAHHPSGEATWEQELVRMTVGLYEDIADIVSRRIPHFTNETTDPETELIRVFIDYDKGPRLATRVGSEGESIPLLLQNIIAEAFGINKNHAQRSTLLQMCVCTSEPRTYPRYETFGTPPSPSDPLESAHIIFPNLAVRQSAQQNDKAKLIMFVKKQIANERTHHCPPGTSPERIKGLKMLMGMEPDKVCLDWPHTLRMVSADKQMKANDGEEDQRTHGKSYELTALYNGMGQDTSQEIPQSLADRLELCAIRVPPSITPPSLAYMVSILNPPVKRKGLQEKIDPHLGPAVWEWLRGYGSLLRLEESNFQVNQVMKKGGEGEASHLQTEASYFIDLNTQWCPAKKDFHASNGLYIKVSFDPDSSQWVGVIGCHSTKRDCCKKLVQQKRLERPCSSIKKCLKDSSIVEYPTVNCLCCGKSVQYTEETGQNRAIDEHMEAEGCASKEWTKCPICHTSLSYCASPHETDEAAQNRVVNTHLEAFDECRGERIELILPSQASSAQRAASAPPVKSEKVFAPEEAMQPYEWGPVPDTVASLQAQIAVERENENFDECARLKRQKDELQSEQVAIVASKVGAFDHGGAPPVPREPFGIVISMQLCRVEFDFAGRGLSCSWLVGSRISLVTPLMRMETKHGESFTVQVVADPLVGYITLQGQETDTALQFSQRAFGFCLKQYQKRVDKPVWDAKSTLCFPLDEHDLINWEAMQRVLDGAETWETATAPRCEVDQTMLWRRPDISKDIVELYHVTKKEGLITLRSPCERTDFESYADYYRSRAEEGKAVPLTDLDEEMVTCSQASMKLHNCSRFSRLDGRTTEPTSRIILPPQLCKIFPLSSPQMKELAMIPSVLAGTERHHARMALINRIGWPEELLQPQDDDFHFGVKKPTVEKRTSKPPLERLYARVSECLTHPQLTQHTGEPNYERLEHFGDRCLKCLVAVQVFSNHPDATNSDKAAGELTKVKSILEENATLRVLATAANLVEHLATNDWLSASNWAPWGVKRERETPGTQKKALPKLSADLVEAFVGAFFCVGYEEAGSDRLSAGLTAARHFTKWIFQVHRSNRGDDKLWHSHHPTCRCTFFDDVHPNLVPTRMSQADEPRLRTKVEELCSRVVGRKPSELLGFLLSEALTPRQFRSQSTDLERLEFLGDAVLDMVVVPHLFFSNPEATPDQLHNLRKDCISNSMFALASVAPPLELHLSLHWPGPRQQAEMQEAVRDLKAVRADKSPGAQPDLQAISNSDEPGVKAAKKSLADSFEAIAAAIFIDAAAAKGTGMDVASEVFLPLVFRHDAPGGSN